MSTSSPETEHDPQNDLLTGNLRRVVFLLALPVLCEQFLSFCVGFYDTWLSGRFDDEATSAIGVAAYVGWLASMIFGLVATGTTALISRNWGAGRQEDANRVMNCSMALAALLGVIVYGTLFFMAPVFTRWLNMTDEVRSIAVHYLQVDAFGHLFTGLTLVGAAALRGAGNMRAPMILLGCVSILNVILSTIFVFGLGPFSGMGLNGIVTGTVTSRVTGGVFMTLALWKGTSGLKIQRKLFTIRDPYASRVLKIGIPAAVDGLIMWGGHFVFLKIVNNLGLGSVAFAAHVVGIELEAITYLPAVAWGHASATLIGQSLGAHDKERARKAGHEAVLQCSLLAMCISAVFFLGADAIYGFMHSRSEVREVGAPAFRLMACFQLPLVIGIIYVFSLRGAGDTRSPLFITLFSMFLIRLPLGYYFGIVLKGGLIGAWIGMCGDMLVRGLLAAIRYAQGKWQHLEV